MAEKKPAAKKSGAAKAAPAKAATKKRVSKGESLVCEVCGLSVVVEEVGGIAVAEEDVLLCCGKPMKTTRAKKVAAKK
jgi:hypothetical protein